ncbi:AmpG family muropeptide MFS transporter [Magnetococcales bacterium HHB-1]
MGERNLKWFDAFRVYTEPRVFAIFLLGFSCGLPLALTASTLSVWMAEHGVDKTTIGLFALAGLPYTLKFLWSPLMDHLPLWGLTNVLGRRRGWLIFTQIALMGSLIVLGFSDPAIDPFNTALIALIVVFFSASQDIVVDAYRVEVLPEHQYAAGAAAYVFGYRVGMLLSSAGALYLASHFSWAITYMVMAGFVIIGMITALLNPEPKIQDQTALVMQQQTDYYLEKWSALPLWAKPFLQQMMVAVVHPFLEFMRRPGWWLILTFILFYKFGDALAGVMSYPFYVEMQFSKIEIANIAKTFGLAATLSGVFLGGVLSNRVGLLKALLWCGILQMISNLMFVLLSYMGHNLWMFAVTIAVENISGGMGTAVFVAYLSMLCNKTYTATQFALLTSFSAVGRTLLSSQGGWLAEQMSWPLFFVLTTLVAIPGLVLLKVLMDNPRYRSGASTPIISS